MPTGCHRIFFPGLCALAGLIAAGCGENTAGRVATIPVSGTVSVAGEPLDAGTISFMPISGTNTASGEIEDGVYTLTTYSKGDGAPSGDYKVSISSWATEPEMGKPGTPAIAQKYFNAETSGLTATVSKQSRKIDFKLDRE